METQTPAGENQPVAQDDANQLGIPPAEATAADGEAEQVKQAPEKTFTQSELDALIQKRLLKERARILRQTQEQLAKSATPAPVEPKRENFQDDQAFTQAQIEALAAQKAEELVNKREREREAAQRRETFQKKAESVAEQFPDFDQVVSDPTLRINEAMAEFIADSDAGPALAYHLGKNPEIADRIADMSPVKAARELARIETELASKPKPKPSNAPEPIKPVGTRGAAASSLPSDDDDINTWMRKERERVRKAR